MKALCMAVPLLVFAAMHSPAVAHASPVDDYVSSNSKTVCAELDQVQDRGDIFRLVLTIRNDSGFSVKDAASVIRRSADADCPWNLPKLQQAGG